VNSTACHASTFGLNGFSGALMMEVRDGRIRVSYLMPGSVGTESGHVSQEKADWALTPDDVAEVVLDLLRSPARALFSRLEMRPRQPPRNAEESGPGAGPHGCRGPNQRASGMVSDEDLDRLPGRFA
jgi:hypothetical protein